MANRNAPLFIDSDITSSPTQIEKMSANYGFAIQLVWAGLVGTAEFSISASLDETNFDDLTLIDPDTGDRLSTLPISGASDSLTVQVDSLISNNVRFFVDGAGASAGTISANIFQIDNQDTY